MTEGRPESERLRDAVSRRWPGRLSRVDRLPAGLAMSDRRYYVVSFHGGRPLPAPRVIAAVAPVLKSRAFVQIRDLLAAHGIRTPEVYAYEEWGDLAVVFQEHLGDALFMHETNKSAYLDALVEITLRLPRIEIPPWATDNDLRRRYDDVYIRSRLRTLVVPAFVPALGRPLREDEHTVLEEGLDLLSRVAKDQTFALAHRDFQSSNIIIRGGALYLIDFQSASLAPVGFDLVCLVHDSYAVYEPETQQRLYELFISRIGTDMTGGVLDSLAAYRKLFDLANFVQAVMDHGLRQYAPYLIPTAHVASELWSRTVDRRAGERLRRLLQEVVERALP